MSRSGGAREGGTVGGGGERKRRGEVGRSGARRVGEGLAADAESTMS